MAEEEERSRPGGGYDPGAGYEEGAEEVGEVAEGATGSDAPDDAVHEGYEDGRGESVVPLLWASRFWAGACHIEALRLSSRECNGNSTFDKTFA